MFNIWLPANNIEWKKINDIPIRYWVIIENIPSYWQRRSYIISIFFSETFISQIFSGSTEKQMELKKGPHRHKRMDESFDPFLPHLVDDAISSTDHTVWCFWTHLLHKVNFREKKKKKKLQATLNGHIIFSSIPQAWISRGQIIFQMWRLHRW